MTLTPVPDPYDAAAQQLATGFRALADELRAELQTAVKALTPAVRPFNMLTIEQTSEFFQVTRFTLVHWERDGLLRPFRAGRVVLYDTREIDRFVRSQQQSDERSVA